MFDKCRERWFTSSMDLATKNEVLALIERCGGLTVVAKAAGVSRQAVFKWPTHGVPPGRAAALALAFPELGPALALAVGRGRGRS